MFYLSLLFRIFGRQLSFRYTRFESDETTTHFQRVPFKTRRLRSDLPRLATLTPTQHHLSRAYKTTNTKKSSPALDLLAAPLKYYRSWIVNASLRLSMLVYAWQADANETIRCITIDVTNKIVMMGFSYAPLTAFKHVVSGNLLGISEVEYWIRDRTSQNILGSKWQ